MEAAAPASDKRKALETCMAQIEKAYGKAVSYTHLIRLVEPVWTTRLVKRTTEPLRTGVRKDIPWILRQTISLGSPCSQAAAIKADSTNQEAVRAANRVPW